MPDRLMQLTHRCTCCLLPRADLPYGFILWAVWFVALGFVAQAVPASAQSPPANRTIRYFDREWSFDDVNVSTLTRWLSRIGVEIPVSLEGRVSGTLAIGVPWGALRDARAWRFGGQVTSPKFTVEKIVLERVRLRLAYRDGSLFVDELRLNLPASPDEAAPGPGLVTGNAQLELIPRGHLRATVEVNGLSLAGVLPELPALQPMQGRLSGRMTAVVDVDEMTRLAAWRVEGPLALNQLVVRGSPPTEASVRIILDRGALVARDFQLRVDGNAISGRASLALRQPYAWGASAHITAVDVPEALALVGRLAALPGLESARAMVQEGRLTTDVEIRGMLSPLSGRATGQAVLEQVQLTPADAFSGTAALRPIDVPELTCRYDASLTAVRVFEINARVAGGELAGAVTLPLTDGAVDARLTWSNVRLAEIVAVQSAEFGVTSGSLQAMAALGELANPAQWRATLAAVLSHATYNGLAITDLQTGEIRIEEGRLTAPELQFQVLGEPAAVALNLNLTAPFGFGLGFDLPRFNLASLAGSPQFSAIADRLTGSVAASGALQGTLQPLLVTGRGRLAGQSVAWDQHRIDAIHSDFAVDRDAVVLSNMRIAAYRGDIAGTATIPLSATGRGSAALSWSAIDLGDALRGLPLEPVAVRGSSSGSLVLETPPGALAHPDRWAASASLELETLDVYEFDFQEVRAADIRLQDGTIVAPRVAAVLDAQPVEALLSLGANAPWPLVVDVQARRFQARRLAGLPYLGLLNNRLTGLADTNTEISVSFAPFEIEVGGSLSLDGVAYDEFHVERISGRYQVDADALTLTEFSATMYGGAIAGQAVIPFSETLEGSARLEWNEIDAGQIAADLLRPPAPLTGTTTGTADVAIPAGQLQSPAAWNLAAQVELPELWARRRLAASLSGELTQRDGQLTYSANGTLLGGRMAIQGTREAAWTARGLAALGTARFTLRGASFTAAQEVLTRSFPPERPLAGTFDVDLASDASPTAWSWQLAAATGAISAGNLALSPGIQIRAAGGEQGVALQQVGGRFAGGELAGAGQWGYSPRQTRSFRVQLRQADLAELLAFVAPDAAPAARGNVDLDIRLRPGVVWQMQVSALASRVDVGGIALRNVNVPLNVQWSPRSGQVVLTALRPQLSLAGGRLNGRMTARRTSGWHVDGRFRFYRVDAATLARSSYASGLLTGTLEIKARNARSARDVQATLLADLEDAQSRGVPVLDQIRSVVPGAGFAGATRFGEGRVEARLTRGVIRLDRLSLANRQLQLYITGNVTLAGRLNLEATAATGQMANPAIARALLTNILAVPAAPAALLLQANDYLSNRVVHLAIRGTLARPSIRLRPFQTLGEEAVRFFLRQSTGGILGRRPLPATN